MPIFKVVEGDIGQMPTVKYDEIADLFASTSRHRGHELNYGKAAMVLLSGQHVRLETEEGIVTLVFRDTPTLEVTDE